MATPKVLILGHSFVRRLQSDLRAQFDERADVTFGLVGTAEICMHGVGGRTVQKLTKYDLGRVKQFSPDIVVPEIGTNDLVNERAEVVGSAIEVLVRRLLNQYAVRHVVLCQVTPRSFTLRQSSYACLGFNAQVNVLNQYTRVVLGDMNRVTIWKHRGFTNPSVSHLLPDGVHFTRSGQYMLYRSYRGAILQALAGLRKA